jgi:hypothetical protein
VIWVRRAIVLSAGASPRLVRIAGMMPRASSRSSSLAVAGRHRDSWRQTRATTRASYSRRPRVVTLSTHITSASTMVVIEVPRARRSAAIRHALIRQGVTEPDGERPRALEQALAQTRIDHGLPIDRGVAVRVHLMRREHEAGPAHRTTRNGTAMRADAAKRSQRCDPTVMWSPAASLLGGTLVNSGVRAA